MSFIQAEMNRLSSLIQFRNQYLHISLEELDSEDADFSKNKDLVRINALIFGAKNPEMFKDDAPAYLNFILKHGLDFYDRVLLVLALTPHILPHFLKYEMHENRKNPFLKQVSEEQITLMGLVQGSKSRAYLPSWLTFVYLLEGDNLPRRTKRFYELLAKKSLLLREGYIQVEDHQPGEALGSGVLWLSRELIMELLSSPKTQKNTDHL